MKTQRKTAMMFVVVVMQSAIILNPALADRFYVALVLPLPGPTPFGKKPTAAAAQGYNAARCIDKPVRAQGGIDDLGLLRQNFRQTAATFTW